MVPPYSHALRGVLLATWALLQAAPALGVRPTNGWVVWASNRNGGIHNIYFMRADGTDPTDVVRLTTDGARMPMWSPDGRWIAYETVPGERTRVMRWNGSEDKQIFVGTPQFWLWGSNKLVVRDPSDNLHQVDPDTGGSTPWLLKSEFTGLGTKAWAPSGLTADGRWLLTWTDRYRNGWTGTNGTFNAYNAAIMLDLNNKSQVFYFGQGCEPTAPPSGDWIYHVCGGTECPALPDLAKMKVADRATRSSYQTEVTHVDTDWGHEYFPRVSNDGVWLVYGATNDGCHDHDTCNYELFFHRVGQGNDDRDRFTVSGANDQWPHLYVGPLWGAEASITLAPASLSFTGVEGGGNPATKTVSVTNSGSGTLANVSATETAGWLAVSRSGSGNTQTLTNAVNLSGLAAGTRTATVTVAASNAGNSPMQYVVTLTVSPPAPRLVLSPTTLTFGATAGGASPAPKNVAVTNAGGGTLATVTATETTAWLSVNRLGSGNSQTLVNTVNSSGLSNGTYNATVQVSAAGAVDSPASYAITLVVAAQPVLAAVEVTATSNALLAGQSTTLRARTLDQFGNPIAGLITWSVSGGGSMVPPSSGGSVLEHTATFVSDSSAGSFTVSATSGAASGSAVLDVAAVTLPLRINCGNNAHSVSGWRTDDSFVTGGDDWTNENEVAVSGVANAAPAAVYKSVRRQSPHAYDIPLPDGNYLLRLHFADAYTDRSMDYLVEGVSLLTGFDIASRAGGVNIALVEDLLITVTGGDGLQIEASSSGDVFEAGLEILSVPNSTPIVEAGASITAELSQAALLDGTVVDDGAPGGGLTITWTALSGPGAVTFADATAEDTIATFSDLGTYVLQLSADDGELEAADTVSVTVVEATDAGDDEPVPDDILPDAIYGGCALCGTVNGPLAALLGALALVIRRRR